MLGVGLGLGVELELGLGVEFELGLPKVSVPSNSAAHFCARAQSDGKVSGSGISEKAGSSSESITGVHGDCARHADRVR